MRPFVITLALILVASASLADSAAPPAAEETTLQGFGAQNPSCLEWNDSCATCLRDGDAVHCSVVGIACEPKVAACVRSK